MQYRQLMTPMKRTRKRSATEWYTSQHTLCKLQLTKEGRAYDDEDECEAERRKRDPAPPRPVEGEKEEDGQDEAGHFRRVDVEPLAISLSGYRGEGDAHR